MEVESIKLSKCVQCGRHFGHIVLKFQTDQRMKSHCHNHERQKSHHESTLNKNLGLPFTHSHRDISIRLLAFHCRRDPCFTLVPRTTLRTFFTIKPPAPFESSFFPRAATRPTVLLDISWVSLYPQWYESNFFRASVLSQSNELQSIPYQYAPNPASMRLICLGWEGVEHLLFG